jgi:Transposase IS4
MGIHPLPHYSNYWSSDDKLRVDAVSSVMSKSRYEKLSQYFHLNNSSRQERKGHDDYDPLYKVRPIMNLIERNIAELFLPGKNISIDEAMIGFNGRLSFKQYIKGKPNPWGIKVG